MARIVMEDIPIGVGVGLFNRFGPALVARLPVVGTQAARIVQFGPAGAGLAMQVLDWRPTLGQKLTLAGLPQATEALLDLLLPPTPMMARSVSYASRTVASPFVGAAPIPDQRRGL